MKMIHIGISVIHLLVYVSKASVDCHKSRHSMRFGIWIFELAEIYSKMYILDSSLFTAQIKTLKKEL